MVDRLRGLKENVIMGRIIPAGTGIVQHQEDIVVGFEGMPVPRLEEHTASFNGQSEPVVEEALVAARDATREAELHDE
jgi:DNA-directed RNA polymerase subunit beta'